MIGRACQVGVRESNSPVWPVTENVPRRRLAVDAEEETRLGIYIGVSPTVENDSGNVAFRIEATRREHVAQLLPKCALVLSERCAQQLGAAATPLLSDGQTWLRKQNLDGEHSRRVRAEGRRHVADSSHPPHREIVAESPEPAAA